jgi:hypothetical protein
MPAPARQSSGSIAPGHSIDEPLAATLYAAAMIVVAHHPFNRRRSRSAAGDYA